LPSLFQCFINFSPPPPSSPTPPTLLAGKHKSLFLQLQALSEAGKDNFLRAIAPPDVRRFSRSPSLTTSKRFYHRSSTAGHALGSSGVGSIRENSSSPTGGSGRSPSSQMYNGLKKASSTTGFDGAANGKTGSPVHNTRGNNMDTSSASVSSNQKSPRGGVSDADQTIIDWIVSEFKKEQGVDMSEDFLALQRLKDALNKAKLELTTTQHVEINKEISLAAVPSETQRSRQQHNNTNDSHGNVAAASGRSKGHVTIVVPGEEEERPETHDVSVPAAEAAAAARTPVAATTNTSLAHAPMPPMGPQPSHAKRPAVPTQRHKLTETVVHAGPVQYTSVSVAADGVGADASGKPKENDALPAAVKAAQALAQKQEAINDAQRKSQLDMHQKNVSKVQELAIKAMRKTGAAEVATARVAEKLQNHNDLISIDRTRVGQLCTGKEYAFVSRDTLRLKQTLFQALESEREAYEQASASFGNDRGGTSPRSTGGSRTPRGALDKAEAGKESEKENQRGGSGAIQAARDMKIVAKRAKKIRYWIVCERLQNAEWIRKFFPAFRDIVRRASMQGGESIPHSAIRLLSVAQLFVMEGVLIDKEAFYIMLEAIITNNADYAKPSVNRIIGAVRESIQIDPESFLAYLVKQDIIPCAELTGQVRELRKKRERDLKEKERSKKGRASVIRRPVNSAMAMTTVAESNSPTTYTDGGATITSTSAGIGAGVRTVTSVSSLYSQLSRGDLSDLDIW